MLAVVSKLALEFQVNVGLMKEPPAILRAGLVMLLKSKLVFAGESADLALSEDKYLSAAIVNRMVGTAPVGLRVLVETSKNTMDSIAAVAQ